MTVRQLRATIATVALVVTIGGTLLAFSTGQAGWAMTLGAFSIANLVGASV